MKWLRVTVYVFIALVVVDPAWDVVRRIMDVWSGLPDPEHRAARVLSTAVAVLQTSTVLLLALPLLSLRQSHHGAANSATMLAVSLTVFWVLVALFSMLSGGWSSTNPGWRQVHLENWNTVMTAGVTLAACIAAAAVWFAGKLFVALRKSRGTVTVVMALLVIIHTAGITGSVLAIRWAQNSGKNVTWVMPVVKSPPHVRLPYHDVCRYCDGTNIIGAAFEDADYELLSFVLDGESSSAEFLHWTAPYGPGLNHMSKWTEMTFLSLTAEMPHLRQDTYDSFIKRNEAVAVHSREQFQTRSGRVVRIAGEGSRNIHLLHYTRAGFSANGAQACIYRSMDGVEVYMLWEKQDGKWVHTESKTIAGLVTHLHTK